MKTLTIAVNDDYVKTLDFVIRSSKLYSSRSEFIKDAVREKVSELVNLNEDLKEIRAASQRLTKKAKAKGWDGSLISGKEREKWAKEYIKSL